MKYLIIKIVLWLKHFGVRGIWIVVRRNLNTLELLTLKSSAYGTIHLRNCQSDIEAVNTVICFEAYKPNRELEKCRTIIDLGGNIGMASKYFRSKIPNAKILALEPAEENSVLFARNLDSDIKNGVVSLICAAVGPESGIGYLSAPGTAQFDAYQVSTGVASHSECPITIVAMKSICDQCLPPIGVKMDIEGGEIAMLEMRSKWIQEVDYLMIEFHNLGQEKQWLDILKKEGWIIHKQFDTWHFSRQSISKS